MTWERAYARGFPGGALIRDIVPTSRGYVLVGVKRAGTRAWVHGVDEAGRSRWTKLLGTEHSAFLSGASATDRLVVAGSTNTSHPAADPEYADPYVVSFKNGSILEWARTYQPDSPDGSASTAIAIDGEFVVAGRAMVDGVERPWATRLTPHGTATWEWTRADQDRGGAVHAGVAVDDGVVLGGAETPTYAGDDREGESAWAGKLTGDGESTWAWTMDREPGTRIEALAVDGSGGVVALGRDFTEDPDSDRSWLARIDASGTERWRQPYRRDDWSRLADVAVLDSGYVLAGTRRSDGVRRGWLLGIDEYGRVEWEHRTRPDTGGLAVQPIGDGGILVAGSARRGADEEFNAWLAKVGGDPAPSPTSTGEPADPLPEVPNWVLPGMAGLGVGTYLADAIHRRKEE